ncbi:MAG TPA: sensory rhodopsin transducer [Gammaproteobacteria bacterium]|nr:sensory rhodopsin transducer [Gammaproteobacteria bacterium]
MATAIGKRRWVIAEGYIPGASTGQGRALESHETVCILNGNDQEAEVNITVYFADREPVGPYRLRIPARRTLHVRFNDLHDPEPIPRDTDYASLIESTLPIVCQHTRLDSRQAELALMTTIPYSSD